jgi:hypothetical protein
LAWVGKELLLHSLDDEHTRTDATGMCSRGRIDPSVVAQFPSKPPGFMPA